MRVFPKSTPLILIYFHGLIISSPSCISVSTLLRNPCRTPLDVGATLATAPAYDASINANASSIAHLPVKASRLPP
ncbi:hypothetical protein EXIGLDRAFT_771809 [Exidia glandulosa HHB12029]|uniref:Uncharacterized protein n=1 Tax=Exidia glandulosa HHB12029 TaxID=1314781 RepID=A0A165FQI9_EXIGL|nr:hypothetical protein EXIGLDRAFT_771809 [Exidia glandulosa HHB12029]